MNFDYNEEQQLLADSVRRFLQKDYDFETRKKIVASKEGWSPQAWSTLTQMGLTGLPFSPDYGGFGGGAIDLMGVMEAFGEALVVEPYLATILSSQLISKSGTAEQKQQILPAVVEGKLRLAFAHTEKGARYRLDHVNATAKKAGGGWTIDGEKSAVLGAPMAEKLVVSVVSAKMADGIGLFLVDAAGVEMKPFRTLDEMRAADIVLKGTKAELLANKSPGDKNAAPLALIEEMTDYATALICAEAVGAMKFACDTTLEYLKTRKQFGVPIGTFQALQHRMVDMFISYEQARSMACLACSKADTAKDGRDRARSISAAKIKIADNARHVSQESVQLHGGMGMSEELKVSHTFRRLTVIMDQFGGADHHLARFAAL
jgi:alkylation response protein AidB-like acyl-CoA dehydrogenase